MTDIVFQSQALAYPPRVSLGSLLLIETPMNIGNQVKMFCETIKGERPLLPDWGLPEIVHKKQASRNEIAAIILANINKYFPGTKFTVNIIRDTVQGLLEIEITYQTAQGYGTVTVTI